MLPKKEEKKEEPQEMIPAKDEAERRTTGNDSGKR